MKNKLQIKNIIAAFALVICFAATGFAQENFPVVGGYKTIKTDDSTALAAAEFAVEEQGNKQEVTIELGDILKAEYQSVKGGNYRLCIEASVDGEDFAQFSVVVYQSLENEFTLKSWIKQKCAK